MVVPLGIEDQINAVEKNPQKTTDDGTEQPVAPVELGVLHIGPHAEDGADTGKGGVSVQKIVDQGAKGGGEGGLEVAQSDMDGGLLGGVFHSNHTPGRSYH